MSFPLSHSQTIPETTPLASDPNTVREKARVGVLPAHRTPTCAAPHRWLLPVLLGEQTQTYKMKPKANLGLWDTLGLVHPQVPSVPIKPDPPEPSWVYKNAAAFQLGIKIPWNKVKKPGMRTRKRRQQRKKPRKSSPD